MIAAIISTVLTAPVFALTVSVMYFDLGGGSPAPAADPVEAPQAPPAP